jgi:hypothetical protein
MTTEEVKGKAMRLDFAEGSGYAWLRELICDGFMDVPVSSADVVHRVSERFGRRWDTARVQTYMRKFAGIVHAVKPRGSRINYWVLASIPRPEALAEIGKSRSVLEVEGWLFAPELESQMRRSFSKELAELHDVFGKHGNCTAFLLRKILEKLLIISFRKSGKSSLIEDPQKPGRLIGLEAIVELAMRERVNGSPILTGKTGTELRGVKFLGDTAAHNPLANVDVAEILPQMPYIVIAYKELALHL